MGAYFNSMLQQTMLIQYCTWTCSFWGGFGFSFDKCSFGTTLGKSEADLLAADRISLDRRHRLGELALKEEHGRQWDRELAR